MTTQQHSKLRGGLVWNLVKWIELKQWARREGQDWTRDHAQKWIDDCRARIQRLNGLERGLQPELKNSKPVSAISEFRLQPTESA